MQLMLMRIDGVNHGHNISLGAMNVPRRILYVSFILKGILEANRLISIHPNGTYR